MKKVYCLLFTVYCCVAFCSAQTMVLGVDRGRDSIPSKRGPNKKSFGCMVISGGFVVGSDEAGARIKYGTSGEYSIGFRAKYKISPVYSLGWETMLRFQYFKLKQEQGKILPDTILHKVERFDIGTLGVSFYNRFNFDPNRGNYLGKFLDLGISAEWIHDFVHLTKDDLPDGTQIKVAQTHLPYKHDFTSDVHARLGINQVSLYARYRISDFFKPHYNVSGPVPINYTPVYPELPRLMLGLEFTFFRG